MKKRNGFTLTELLIAVAIMGIVAAVAIPLLVRARVAANESATLGDIRTLISAQASYRSANGGFFDGSLDCLTSPSSANCIPSYPTSGPTFLDSMLASLRTKAGYNRLFTSGPVVAPPPPNASPTSVLAYRYDATPLDVGVTGVRGFAGGSDSRDCFTSNGMPVPPGPGSGTLPPTCEDVR
jgi:type IV pilus assembly protein PilA